MSTSFPKESNSKTPSSSSPLPANEQTIGKECRQCLSFLTRALNQSGRPRSLLKALGVLPDDRAIHDDDDSQTLYKPTPDGRGIALPLSQASATRPSPVSLQRRLTDAASRVVGGGTAAVLTTSPALESTRSSPLNHALHIPTAVTIECQTCGFDTRAEAGGETGHRTRIVYLIPLIRQTLVSSSLRSPSLRPRTRPPRHRPLLQSSGHAERSRRSPGPRIDPRLRYCRAKHGFETMSFPRILGSTRGEGRRMPREFDVLHEEYLCQGEGHAGHQEYVSRGGEGVRLRRFRGGHSRRCSFGRREREVRSRAGGGG